MVTNVRGTTTAMLVRSQGDTGGKDDDSDDDNDDDDTGKLRP